MLVGVSRGRLKQMLGLGLGVSTERRLRHAGIKMSNL